MNDDLRINIHRIHTTERGIQRIQKNLKLTTENVVDFCKQKILDPRCVLFKQGKNWYCEIDFIRITIHCTSYTIITAHLF